MVIAYLGLGANLGDREANLKGARAALATEPGLEIIRWSSLFETEPVGGPAQQPAYLNAVLAVATHLPPRALLECCQEIELQFGRIRSETWGPRTLDIDLLLYNEQILQEEGLTVPHPYLAERAFVLVPLMEVAADAVHPVLQLPVSDLFAGVTGRYTVHPYLTDW